MRSGVEIGDRSSDTKGPVEPSSRQAEHVDGLGQEPFGAVGEACNPSSDRTGQVCVACSARVVRTIVLAFESREHPIADARRRLGPIASEQLVP